MESRSAKMFFAHLHVHTEFSFCDGASSVESLVRIAAQLGQSALAITDHDNLCGAPSFAGLCRKAGIKPLIGAELTLDTGNVIAIARTRQGYSSLCKLISKAHLTNERGKPCLPESTLLTEGDGLIVLTGSAKSPLRRLIRSKQWDKARDWINKFCGRFQENFYIELLRTFEPELDWQTKSLLTLAEDCNASVVATNNVHYAQKKQHRAQDVLTCIRYLIPITEPHEERKINGELYLKSAADMTSLFSDIPLALENTRRIVENVENYEISDQRFLPRFFPSPAESSQHLKRLTYVGAKKRYETIPAKLQERLDYELSIVSMLNFADYFLIVHDLLQFARTQNIRFAGRGSAGDSVIAYALGITNVDAFKLDLRFERFINPERATSLPDIDIDFDTNERDRVTEYVVNRYGKDHVATVCTFSRFLARSAFLDIAKVFGIKDEEARQIRKCLHWATPAWGITKAVRERPELRALNIPVQRYQLLFELCAAISELPRHMSTHCGGVVITGDPIWEIAPVQMAAKGIQVTQFDKFGIEDLECLLKVDLLGLGMFGALQDATTWITDRDQSFEYEKIPTDDTQTFERIRRGGTAGAFQLESAAQMSLHPRLKTRAYGDCIAAVALIRPGPIQGDMVEPFIRRRNGLEPIQSIHPIVDKILAHTYGVVIYQEQVIAIAIELAGFSAGEADVLRRTISSHRSSEKMVEVGEIFIAKAMSKGITRELAEVVFSWIQGYAGYGFCEAHAAAFGDTAYRTVYLLEHFPAEFYAALLNNQPMGFYPTHTLVNEAALRGIRVAGPDINCSGNDFSVIEGTIYTGLKCVKGISESDISSILSGRPFWAIGDFLKRTKVSRDVQENLVLSGAFDAFCPNRKALLYSLGTMVPKHEGELALHTGDIAIDLTIKDMSPFNKLCFEWEILGYSPTCHPTAFWQEYLAQSGANTTDEIKKMENVDKKVLAAGWVIRPHTPPTRSGKRVIFFSIEDWTGLLNVTVFPDIAQKCGNLLYTLPAVIVEGRVDPKRPNNLVASSIRPLPNIQLARSALAKKVAA